MGPRSKELALRHRMSGFMLHASHSSIEIEICGCGAGSREATETTPCDDHLRRSVHGFPLSGCVISSGLTHESNCCCVTKPSFRAASRKLRSSRYAVSEIFAAFSYPMCGLRAVTSISELLRCSLMRFLFGSIPTAQRSQNERDASATSSIDVSKLCRITGLYTFSWKLPCEPANATAWSLPKTWTATIVSASH